jgi:hypothetical protein
MADSIGASREALLIRFVTLRRASWEHYREWKAVFDDERRQPGTTEEKKEPRIKRPIWIMSWNGRGFIKLVLRSYYDQLITLNDVSSYVGAKVKYILDLGRAAANRIGKERGAQQESRFDSGCSTPLGFA